MQNRSDLVRQALEAVERTGKQKVKVAIVDIDGVLRGKYIHIAKFESALESGFGFCDVVFGWDCNDVCYDNTKYTGWHTGYPDALARIDLATQRTVPWDDGIAFFLADFERADGDALPVCPRRLLKKITARAEALGYTAMVGVEYEWFNFRETPQSLADKGYARPQPLTPGMFGYSVLRAGHNRDYFNALMDELSDFGVPIEGLHTETGPGVYEAAMRPAAPVEAADRAVLFKAGAKEIGHRFNIMPTFMAKWDAKLPGCSGHLHQSLWDNSDRDRNVFYDAHDPHRLSDTFRHYLAGQMRFVPELLPFLAPTVNSYKRLVEGHWAPTRVTWGIDNRTVAFRAIPGSDKSTRLETRVPGADINPYLALAAVVGAGLYGIEKRLELPSEPISGNGYEAEGVARLAGNLAEATDLLERSQVARELFGDDMVDHFVATRRWEWREFQKAVTSWELERYFEII